MFILLTNNNRAGLLKRFLAHLAREPEISILKTAKNPVATTQNIPNIQVDDVDVKKITEEEVEIKSENLDFKNIFKNTLIKINQQQQQKGELLKTAFNLHSLQLTHKALQFFKGPLRSNFLISLQILKLISQEQRILPAKDSWPLAKASYISSFEALKNYSKVIRAQGFSLFLSRSLSEITWGQVGRVLRVSAEMASFYYIGKLVGMIIYFPFSFN